MLRDTFISLMGKRLGNRTDLDASILLEMVNVQENLLEGNGALLPWFLLTPLVTSTDTVAGDEKIALPADFISWSEEHPIWLYDAAASPKKELLAKKNYWTMTEKYPEPGRPRFCSEFEGTLALHPTPDAVYTIQFRYLAKDTALDTGNIENKWLKHASDWMMAEVGAIMAGRYLQNPKLESQFIADKALARSRLLILHEAKNEANRTRQMGED